MFPRIIPRPSPAAVLPFAYPLDEFYALAKRPLPAIEQVEGEDVPEPYRKLLVHQHDMTPTLEKFHDERIYLNVISRQTRGDFYFREVILLTQRTRTPVEFGAIKINLALFPAGARRLILEEQEPLGTILGEFKISHTSRPKAFLRIEADAFIKGALQLARQAGALRPAQHAVRSAARPLAEIVEILPSNEGTLMKASADIDVLIIGAGPAGATAAALLAEHGHRVLVLEREKFPRYHIGESLLPFCYEPLKRLGLIEKMKASHFVKKYSVQFVSPNGKASQPFYFFNRYDRETVAQTWQVLRSEFDAMLVDNARAHGRNDSGGDHRHVVVARRRTGRRRAGPRQGWRGAGVSRAHHARLLRQGSIHRGAQSMAASKIRS